MGRPKKTSKKLKPISAFLSNKGKDGFGQIPFKKLFISSFVLNILTIGAVIAFRKFLPPEVPLFYGNAIPEDKLAPTIILTLPAAVSLAIAIVNIGLSQFTSEVFIKQLLIVTAFALSLISTITTLKILFLVGSV